MMKRCVWILLACLILCGCKTDKGDAPAPTPEGEPVVEVEANDYNGAVNRMYRVCSDARAIIDAYTEKAKTVMDANPTDYWNKEDFFHIRLDFPDNGQALANTMYLNERQAWAETVPLVLGTIVGAQENQYGVTRNAEHDYSIWYKGNYTASWGDVFGWRNISAIYDADHDWLRTYIYDRQQGYQIAYLDWMCEYGRYGNCFLIQTQSERLAIAYKADNTIDWFLYSKLNLKEERAKYHPYVRLYDEEGNMTIQELEAEKDGKLLTQYDETDSLFRYFSGDINREVIEAWVFAEPTVNMSALYESTGELSIRKVNELSGNLEVFVVSADGKLDKWIEEPSGDEVFGLDMTEEPETDPEDNTEPEADDSNGESNEEVSDEGTAG